MTPTTEETYVYRVYWAGFPIAGVAFTTKELAEEYIQDFKDWANTKTLEDL